MFDHLYAAISTTITVLLIIIGTPLTISLVYISTFFLFLLPLHKLTSVHLSVTDVFPIIPPDNEIRPGMSWAWGIIVYFPTFVTIVVAYIEGVQGIDDHKVTSEGVLIGLVAMYVVAVFVGAVVTAVSTVGYGLSKSLGMRERRETEKACSGRGDYASLGTVYQEDQDV